MKIDDSVGVIMEKIGRIKGMSKQVNNCDKGEDRECDEKRDKIEGEGVLCNEREWTGMDGNIDVNNRKIIYI